MGYDETALTTEQPADGAVTHKAIEELRRLVGRGNARWKRLVILEALGLAVAAPLACLWLVFFLDNILHLPTWGRIAANGFFLAVVAWLCWRLVRSWRRARFTEDEVALAIERSTPGMVENRLINSIQLSREANGSGSAISRAVVMENYRHLRQIHLERAGRSRPALIRIAFAALVVLVGGLFYGIQRERFTNAATRILLPFAQVAPVYRTVLVVDPGNVEAKAGDDVTIRIRIEGAVPRQLAVLRNVKGERTSVELPVRTGSREVSYTFKSVVQSVAYAVRGGDFTTPFYTINVPTASQLALLTAVCHFPEYTGRPGRKLESTGGDLEALYGTRAELRFQLTDPVDDAAMLVERVGSEAAPSNGAVERVELTRTSPTEYAGEIVFKDVVGYRLETRQAGRPPVESKSYALRVTADLAPDLRLAGIESPTEVMPDAILPVTLIAKDDYGLEEVGLFFKPRAMQPVAGAPDDWRPIQAWPVADRADSFDSEYALPIAALNAVEGEEFELALRGRDTDPLKGETWTTGQRYTLRIGGAGVALQLLYEQILRSESEIRKLIAAEEKAEEEAARWTRQLDPSSGLRWDDQKNLNDLGAAMREQAKQQSQLREQAAATARAMAEESGNLRISVGMLADTEMVRCIAILEGVASRDLLQAKRAALADARLTQERSLRSLREILEQYVLFRQDWELANMGPFTKMLAEREERMRGESLTYATLPASAATERLPAATSRRQMKLLELSGLAQTAFAGMGQRAGVVGELLAKSFADASSAFDSRGVKSEMQQAADRLTAAQWTDASAHQEQAAAALAAIHLAVLKVQAEAAKQALADLQDLAKSDAQAQQEIERLKPGSSENLLNVNPDALDLKEVIHMQETADAAKNRQHSPGMDKTWDYMFEEQMKAMLQSADTGKRQKLEDLTLASKPSGQMSFPNSSDRVGNRVTPHIQEKFDDLVGDLLEEADDLREQYETYNINTGLNISETGDVGKQGGDLNSTAAASATGNMKPPTQNFGGASRTGRQGARAHGMVVGEESINRRGRDEVQEGQQEVPDQQGEMKETKSSDPQADVSTGIGGKEVKGDQPNTFSTKDAGEWKDEMAERMKPPEATNQVVERQGKPLDPRVAEMLRDLDSTQEQVIERIKTIKKELDNLYLPTDQLDEIMNQLKANLDRLKEKPDAEIFRAQMETIDKLKGTIVVFNRPTSEFQPSLARDQVIRGQILDEPPWQTIPGYEDAVKRYYEKLAEP